MAEQNDNIARLNAAIEENRNRINARWDELEWLEKTLAEQTEAWLKQTHRVSAAQVREVQMA